MKRQRKQHHWTPDDLHIYKRMQAVGMKGLSLPEKKRMTDIFHYETGL